MRLFANTSVRRRLFRLMLVASALALLCVAAAVVVYEATSFRPRVLHQIQDSSRLLLEVLPASLGRACQPGGPVRQPRRAFCVLLQLR